MACRATGIFAVGMVSLRWARVVEQRRVSHSEPYGVKMQTCVSLGTEAPGAGLSAWGDYSQLQPVPLLASVARLATQDAGE